MSAIDDLKVKPENVKPHLDIAAEMLRHKKNWYHFEIRMSGGMIVDFVVREYVDYEKIK